ncbi:MAG: hypothetical protein LBH75_05255 [Treponema sp.]|jgi:hypothetical protein|nr:hypothetical protein [Treponema sp.]
MKKLILILYVIYLTLPSFGQERALSDVFPYLDTRQKTAVFSKDGLALSSKEGKLFLSPVSAGLNMTEGISRRNYPYVTEYLIVLPFKGIRLVDIYNALGRIRDLKGRLYHSATKNQDIPLFEDATRIMSDKKTTPVPDPDKVLVMPKSETIFIRLKDSNFGSSYYRAEILTSQDSIICTLTNFRSLNFFFVPVIRENNFSAQLYVEPVSEGILIYSIAGTNVSDFVAKYVDMNSAIKKRLDVLDAWIVDGIK